HPGRSVAQIREEDALRRQLRSRMDSVTSATRAGVWGELRSGGAASPPTLPFWVRYSLRGWRGPKRALELVHLVLRASLILAGVAAFCAFVAFARSTGNDLALGLAIGSVSIAPLLVGSGVLWLHPRHLTPRGGWLVLRGALAHGARAFATSAALVGLVLALLPGASGRWLPFSIWEVLAAALPWAIGLAIALALLAVITVAAYVLAGWIFGVLACAIGLALAVAG